MMKNLYLRKVLLLGTLLAFLANGWVLPSYGSTTLATGGGDIILPVPGTRVSLSPAFSPAILKGIKVHPDNPFRFDFILDQGTDKLEAQSPKLKAEAQKLIKYFLASLTIPEKDLWVNLSPYEKDRIVPESFGQTEMGRDLLAQDYMLKQITASLIYPEDEIGKKFWKRIYEETAKKFGTTNVPVNTFNKVWIVPEKAVVYENFPTSRHSRESGFRPDKASVGTGTAYVVESRLKVLLEEDYLALEKNELSPTLSLTKRGGQSDSPSLFSKRGLGGVADDIVREVVIPELTKEVNEGKNFAQLRQVYNSLILATWYKKKIKDSILSQVYADKNKIKGVNMDDPQEKQKIYERYLQAFKKGAYNYIKEDRDPLTQKVSPRKYFSGGVNVASFGIEGIEMTADVNKAMAASSSGEVVVAAVIAEPPGLNESLKRVSPEGQKAEEFFKLLMSWKKDHTDANFGEFPIDLLSIPIPEDLFNPDQGQQAVSGFGHHLNKIWHESGNSDKYGSIYYIMTLCVDGYFSFHHERMRLQHEWLYHFISSADLQVQAISLWLVLVSNIMHLQFEGMHPEWDKGRSEYILFDLETIFGNEYGHKGALPRYLKVLDLLKKEGHLDDQTQGLSQNSLRLGDVLLWALVLVADTTVHDRRYVNPLFKEPADSMARGSANEFMMTSMRKRFGFIPKGAGKWFRKALKISEEGWRKRGFISPYGQKSYATKLVYYYGNEIRLFDFLVPGWSFSGRNHPEFHVMNPAIRALENRLAVYREVWPALGIKAVGTSADNKDFHPPAKGGIDFNADKINLETKMDSRFRRNDEGIQFHINPAMLQQFQNAPGFTPVIINIQPMTDLRLFLGLEN